MGPAVRGVNDAHGRDVQAGRVQLCPQARRSSAAALAVAATKRGARLPAVNSRWVWEHGKPDIQETITVTAVKWNGEEWWVQGECDPRPRRGLARGVVAGKPYWNDLGRFWEAVSAL